jgi:hypothetical protein
MDTSTDIELLMTKRKKTINFYNKYKNIDFEDINEMMIDLLENIINNISGEMTNSITKELIMMMRDQKTELSTIKTDLESVKNNILLKLHDIKDENIDNIKILISNNDNENIIKIIDKIEKENKRLIEEIIPKSNSKYYNEYENLMRTFKEELKTIDNLEPKYNNLLRNIEMSLTTSELRMGNRISEIKNIESSIITYISNTEQRIQNNILEIKNNEIRNTESQQKINEDLIKYLDKYKNSTKKGIISENHIENLLNNIYKTGEIRRTTDESKSGDFVLIRDNISILFEIKNYNRNIPSHEVLKFERDVIEKNLSGIMMSISTGICNKYNYQIDITKNNNICLYIHDLNYDADKIKLGVDIIDNLYSKLKLNNKNATEININEETLELINKEYQLFIQKRELAINHIKESSKKTIQYIEEIELSNLNQLLLSKYIFNNTSVLECDLCRKFVGINLKSLAGHKKKCMKMTRFESENNELGQNIVKTLEADNSEEMVTKVMKGKKINKII